MMRYFAMFLGALAVAGCTVQTPAGTAPLGPGATYGGGTYSSPGGITVGVEMRNFGGKTGVCGVWAESESQSVLTKGRSRMVVDSGVIVFGGDAVLHGLGQFAKVAPARDYAGQMGNCFVSARPWTAADAARAPQIVIPRQIVHRDIDDFGGGGAIVVFRPGGPSAHPSDPKPWD